MKTRRYIAFLRAINVGGRVVKMKALKRIFEDLRLTEVETFIASGNVIFSSPADAAWLESLIEKGLQQALGYPVVPFLRTPEEIATAAERDPFGVLVPPGGRIYVGFLRTCPTAAARRHVEALSTPADRFAVHGRELYWLCTVPSTQSGVSGATLEGVLKQPATLRNLNTVQRLSLKYPSTQ